MSTSLTDLTPADRHRAIAADFEAVVAAVPDWDAPSPVQEWRARDVVEHLLGWLPEFLAAGGVALPAQELPSDDLLGAWRRHSAAVQSLLDDPETAGATFVREYIPEQPLGTAIDRFYSADVFQHTWDLARAAAAEVELDPALCTELVEGMAPIEELVRGSGQYGPAVEVPEAADPQTRLIGFIGRDPAWAPPAGSTPHPATR